jgi:GNAT superfamily N-acetyltransferase
VSGPLSFSECAASEVPLALLLLADPNEAKMRSYLERSRCFVALHDGRVAGACVVEAREAGVHELMNIAVDPAMQKTGVGTALLRWVIDIYRKAGATQLEVGTGSFGYQLAFYQRQGFRVSAIDRDFFIDNYPEPIIEDGIQLFDMLRLTLAFDRGPSPRVGSQPSPAPSWPSQTDRML